MCVCLPSSSNMHLATLRILLKLQQYLVCFIRYLLVCKCVSFAAMCFEKQTLYYFIRPLIMCSVWQKRNLVFGFPLEMQIVFFVLCRRWACNQSQTILSSIYCQQPITNQPQLLLLPATNHEQSSFTTFANNQSQTNLFYS